MHKTIEPTILYFGTPVALVSTMNADGTPNLAPMSSAWWLGWSCMLGLGQMVLGYVQRFGLMRASTEIEAHMRTLMFDHFTRMSFKFYDHVQTGQLISRANSDIRAIQMFLGFGPMMAVAGLSFVAALVLMFQMDVKLTLLSMLMLPFLYGMGAQMRKKLEA